MDTTKIILEIIAQIGAGGIGGIVLVGTIGCGAVSAGIVYLLSKGQQKAVADMALAKVVKDDMLPLMIRQIETGNEHARQIVNGQKELSSTLRETVAFIETSTREILTQSENVLKMATDNTIRTVEHFGLVARTIENIEKSLSAHATDTAVWFRDIGSQLRKKGGGK